MGHHRVGQVADQLPASLVREMDACRLSDQFFGLVTHHRGKFLVDPLLMAIRNEADADQRTLQNGLKFRRGAFDFLFGFFLSGNVMNVGQIEHLVTDQHLAQGDIAEHC